ncbi:DEAD/DEAH box helicase [Nocardiopsis rhodophaea]|uniref:DEAD/DEAH box helicase n=1 Tax=Nocardiopsis rhodophaea TaxID=280238 RepID=A0ABN2S3C2_9ACTN
MRVIEAFWSHGRLCVWGLDSTLPLSTVSRKRVRPHPYALSHEALAEETAALLGANPQRLAELVADVPPDEGGAAGGLDREHWLPQPHRAVVRLPGSARHPFAPPALGVLDAPTVAASQIGLRPWEVPTLDLHPGDSLRVLRRFRSTVAGAGSMSLPHLEVLAQAADSLVDAGRVVPRLVTEDPADLWPGAAPSSSAWWYPVLDPQAFAWLRSLAAAAPPVLRAHHGAEPTDPWEIGSQVVADALDALCAFTDRTVRERLDGREFALPSGPRVNQVWFEALLVGDGDMLGYAPPRDYARLTEALTDWFAETHRQAGAVRLVLRLVEPDPVPLAGAGATLEEALEGRLEETDPETSGEDDGGGEAADVAVADEGALWHLELWAQSAEEPSLMLPLDEALADSGADWLPRNLGPAVDAALRRAVTLYPRLGEEAGGTPRECGVPPGRVELDTEEACAFLTHHAAELAEAGFGLMLPPWAGRHDATATLNLRQATETAPTTAEGIGDRLVEFDYRLALGGVELTHDQLEALARLKAPLIRMRGEWAHLDPARLKAAADAVARRGSGTVSEAEALRLALQPDLAGVEVEGVRADGDLGALLEGRADQEFSPMEDPPGLHAHLRPYQRRGAAWLRYLDRLGLGALLADDMGLGKTVQLLAVLADERTNGHRPAPTLVVCPTSVVGNWHKEAARFAPGLTVHVQHGPDRPRGVDLKAACAAADAVVTTYGTLRRDAEELAALDWQRVVCDEAQNIKNSRTATWSAVRSIPAASRVALTGTPVENRLGELWSIMEFANPGLLGSREGFEKRTASAIERDPSGERGAAAAARLRRATAPFVLRRTKTDRSIIADLPDKQEMTTWCTLTAEQASLYKAAVDEMLKAVSDATGIQRKGLVLATMTRLKQICNHPAHVLGDGSRLRGRSGKLIRLEELLAEMADEGDKALCFTQYTEFGDRLAPYLEGRLKTPVLWLSGKTPRKQREAMVDRFQNLDGPAVFLLSLTSAGTGLNLTAANQVVHIDRWWNPAVEEQATDRAYRIGQTRTVQVRKMICMGTLEERVDAMIERKKALARTVIGGRDEDWLSELSVDDLREVVRLAPEAVSG